MPNVSGVVMGAADSTRRTTPGSFLESFKKTTTVPHRLARPVSPGREP